MERFGVMLDCSRNAVMTKKSLFSYIDYLKGFGYNSIMLYTEDTYEVNNEPYFGYLRGRYGKEELKEIDAYCRKQGIELIPCIQTLAHLNAIFRWKDYAEINDIDDVLLIDDERTYKFIENMFDTVSECFTSRVIHIGMDEAHHVGLGKFLDKHGFKNRFDILYKHLNKVIEIAKGRGFECVMWSDMFFRLANNGDYYVEPDFKFSQEVKEKLPESVGMVYWDYYHEDKKDYDVMIDAHRDLTEKPIWFAGGAWSWIGFAPSNEYTLKSMVPAMQSCKEKGVENIFITCWGDNGAECSKFALLPSLYYIKRIYDGVKDERKIKDEFLSIVGESFDDMMALDLPNKICGVECEKRANPCKYVLYSDLFYGFLDTGLVEGGEEEYKRNADILKGKTNGKFGYLFETEYRLCDLLSDKYRLGLKIRSAYKSRDLASVKKCIEKIDVIIQKLQLFYSAFKKQWFNENKPNGFDVQDLRIGGLERRLISCKERLQDYVSGKIDAITELEEELLDYNGNKDKSIICYNQFSTNATVNVL